jgi:hypothetical protein
MKLIHLTWCTVVLFAASACGASFARGSGTLAEDQRTIGAWKTLRVESGIHATVVRGAPGVTVATDDNLLQEVETVLEGTTLVVRLRPWTTLDTRLGVTATVSGDVLEGVDASGAAVVTGTATPTQAFPIAASGSSVVSVDGLDTTDLRVDASGASRVTALGHAVALAANASGASTIDARGVPVERATIDGSGASTLQLEVRTRIDGVLSGGSHLAYGGGASSSVVASGGSTVTSGN